MPARLANCPNCGAQVEFKAGTSLLAVCTYCSSAVARTGPDVGELEILGKVAPLAALGSPLRLGTTGKYDRRTFTLVGRLQLDYGLGPWNEWYAAFDDGAWGWVAEAAGKLYLTFGKPAETKTPWPHWKVGARVKLGKVELVVTERRRARFISAEGELPSAVTPGSEFKYCDLSGPGEIFGTLDFGTGDVPEMLFLGRELRYDELFTKDVLADVEKDKAGGSVGMNCPNCGASVELRAPDDAQRVTCPSCDSLLDCSGGSHLALLQAAKRKGPEPRIPLGSTGKYRGDSWIVYGHLVRAVTIDGIKYTWEEYLVRNEKLGYRWLLCSAGHWSWIDPAQAGDVKKLGSRRAEYRGKTFRHFQKSSPKVEHLRGEFYWKVSVGETVVANDYVDPPHVLSEETSPEETVWSIGHYLRPAEVERIFSLKKPLPDPVGVYSNQPNPAAASYKGMIGLAGIFSAILLVLGIMVAGASANERIYEASHLLGSARLLAPTTDASAEAKDAQIIVTDPFEVPDKSNLEVNVTANVDNSWLFLGGALINEKTDEVRAFGVDVSYYHGYSGGESWSEGGREDSAWLGELEPGTYVLRLQPEWDKGGPGSFAGAVPPTQYSVTVRRDVFLPSHLVLFLFLLWVGPVFLAARYFMFEHKRWQESDYASG